jgi:hypothetical protein
MISEKNTNHAIANVDELSDERRELHQTVAPGPSIRSRDYRGKRVGETLLDVIVRMNRATLDGGASSALVDTRTLADPETPPALRLRGHFALPGKGLRTADDWTLSGEVPAESPGGALARGRHY